jgi:hypothetical protein
MSSNNLQSLSFNQVIDWRAVLAQWNGSLKKKHRNDRVPHININGGRDITTKYQSSALVDNSSSAIWAVFVVELIVH